MAPHDTTTEELLLAERKRAEEALRESENKFRNLFQNMNDGFGLHKIILDDAGKPVDYVFVEVNDVLAGRMGMKAEDLIDRRALELFPHTEQAWIDVFGRVALTGEPAQFTSYAAEIRKYYEARIYCPRHGYFAAVFVDITERKNFEQLLMQERERLAITLRSIGDGVITTDMQGVIGMLNKAAEEMTGWTSSEAVGRPLLEVFNIVNELTREPCENPVEKVLKTGSVIELANHTSLISKDEREIQIADSGAPIRDAEGSIIGVVLVFRDMTEKQKLTDSIQREQKLESLGILAGGIAHDFNNMLAGIFGYLDMAKESAIDSDNGHIAQFLEKALGVFERAKGLTQQLLTFSKGGIPVRKTTQIAPLIRHSANFALSGSNVTCRLALADDLWLCDCDEDQIGQVIDNIVINAKQAMPMGGNIDITASNVVDEPGHPGKFIRISIADQGSGIPEEIITKIFDPFFSTKITGHGLGLATVHSIIQRHDGWVDVASTRNAGTTFTVFIPASRMKTMPVLAHDVSQHRGSGTILVMDDEDFILEILGTMLQSMGYSVVRTKDGHEAIRLYSEALKTKQPFAASILDMTIPGGLGGRVTAAAIRELNPDAIIIASSGYSDDPVIANPTQYGFTARLIKPYRKFELTELMLQIMPRT